MAQVKGDCALANCPLQPAQAVPSLPSQTRLRLAEAYASQSQSDFSAKLQQMVRDGQRLSRQIEKLAPAVDREQTPANVEYPWIDGHSVFIPCLYGYTNFSLLTTPGGLEFLRLIKTAITDFSSITLSG